MLPQVIQGWNRDSNLGFGRFHKAMSEAYTFGGFSDLGAELSAEESVAPQNFVQKESCFSSILFYPLPHLAGKRHAGLWDLY